QTNRMLRIVTRAKGMPAHQAEGTSNPFEPAIQRPMVNTSKTMNVISRKIAYGKERLSMNRVDKICPRFVLESRRNAKRKSERKDDMMCLPFFWSSCR